MSVLDWMPPAGDLDERQLILATEALRAAMPFRMTGYVPWALTPHQGAYLMDPSLESFYGGAAGGGKSVALLAGALQYVDVPGYSALLLRRTLEELKQPSALIDLSRAWLAGTDARYNGSTHTWTFPSGATLGFGYLRNPGDERRYQSAAYQYIGFDELTAFEEAQYTFLFSRLRRPKASPRGKAPDGLGLAGVPLRIRSASNPGGPGHDWVKDRFVDPKTRIAPFFPATLEDNPHLDAETYLAALALMSDPVTRERMRAGDWDVLVEGTRFQREWLSRYVDVVRPGPKMRVRYWDLAATEPSAAAPDPDYSVGTLLALYADGEYVVEDVERFRLSSAQVETRMKAVARADGRLVRIGIEQEPGQSGKSQVEYFQRGVLLGYQVEGVRPSGSKFTRAGAVASAAEQGRLKLLRADWNRPWVNELTLFREDEPGNPYRGHDDQVDSLSGAFELIHKSPRAKGRRTRASTAASFARPR